jgi:hypothetical protein
LKPTRRKDPLTVIDQLPALSLAPTIATFRGASSAATPFAPLCSSIVLYPLR